MKNKILFIEDQQDLGNVTKQYLEVMDFDVTWCTDGKEAYRAFSQNPNKFQLLIIDIQLPGMNGFDLAEKIIRENDSVPFLFLTARNEKQDRLRGLKIGADDYISKPFDIDELVLRIRNIIRRNHASDIHANTGDGITCGDIVLNKELLKLSIAGQSPIVLTLRETGLLEYLCLHSNSVLKREDLLIELWGENDYFLGRSLDVFISRLRKILAPSRLVNIDNVYGVGFIFNVKKTGG